MEQFKKLISSLLTLAMAVAITGAGYASHAYAAQLTNASATLADPTSGVSTSYTITFKVATAGQTLGEVDFVFANSASAGTTEPTGMSTTSSTLTSVTGPSGPIATFTLNHTTDGTLKLVNSDVTTTYSAGNQFTFVFGAINSNTTTGGGQCDAITDSDSCFIRINAYAPASDAGSPFDTTTITYTVVNPVTVTATVDPILIFTLSGVNSGQDIVNDANSDGGTGTQVTTTSTTIPFGHLTVAQRVLGQQKLSVETNANNGYNVYNRFTTSTSSQFLIGSASSSNHFSPYGEGGATYAAPTAWASPTGTTANTNTAEIGIRTSDGSVSSGNFGSLDKYGTPTNSSNGVLVKTSTTPDNGGSSTNKFVTFKVEANAFQPADSYTGTMVYEVVASY